MSYRSYCDNEREHEDEGRRDFERRGRFGYDDDRYHNDGDACDQAYSRGFDEERRREDRRREEREEQEAHEQAMEQRRYEARQEEEAELDAYYAAMEAAQCRAQDSEYNAAMEAEYFASLERESPPGEQES
jgi:hypothetical protein